MQFELDAKDVTFEGNIRGRYVYHITKGLVVPTRYVFQQPWTDMKLVIAFVNGEETFLDSNDQIVLCFEKDETGYCDWEK
tara:strand:- start:298 stop:537 length:240 start_codon:yes stop_codon:yes gene_type:complete